MVYTEEHFKNVLALWNDSWRRKEMAGQVVPRGRPLTLDPHDSRDEPMLRRMMEQRDKEHAEKPNASVPAQPAPMKMKEFIAAARAVWDASPSMIAREN